MNKDLSRVISVFSTKGGVGKTLIAVNIAVSLSQLGKRVALLDLDLQFGGDVIKMLNVVPKATVFSLIPKLGKINNGAALKAYMTPYASGLDILPAVNQPKEAPQITAVQLDKIIAFLKTEYDYIIIDAGAYFTDVLIHLFDRSNLVLLVATPDVLSVYQTEWSVDTLQNLHFPLKMFKIVLNRAESRGGVYWEDIKSALKCEVIAHLPSDGRSVGLAVNHGQPYVIEAARSKIAEKTRKLAEDLINRPELYMEEVERPQASEEAPRTGRFWEEHGMSAELKVLPEKQDEIIYLKQAVHKQLIEKLDLKKLDVMGGERNFEKAKQLREKTEKLISNILAEHTSGLIPSYEMRKELVKEIADEALGLGPLEDLLRDSTVTEVMVNNKDLVYVERNGKIEITNKKFISNDQVRAVIERIIAPLGRRIDESVPMVDARLPDGSRVNAIIPPLSLKGPTLTIRKFSRERFSLEDLTGMNSLSKDMSDFLKACILVRKNMIISGGTGSGKTTLLNALSQHISDTERIITIEDAAELKLQQTHWVSLESRAPNIEGKGAVAIRDLFRNTLRMRPDRIIIGECRGEETPDMLQAMNTGHDGSMTTIHANSTHHVLSRLDSMVLMSGVDLPVRAIREQIAGAIHLIVHTARLGDGSRRVMCITQLVGMESSGEIVLKDIFAFKQSGIDKDGKVLGEFIPTGFIPTFLEEIQIRGVKFAPGIFTRQVDTKGASV